MKYFMKFRTPFVFLIFISACGCSLIPRQVTSPSPESAVEMTPKPSNQLRITDFNFNRSFYFPNEHVILSIQLTNLGNQPTGAIIRASIKHLEAETFLIKKEIFLSRGAQNFEITYTPPPEAPKGYGIDLCIETLKGEILDCISTGFDVLNNWTQHPRYGFLSDFFPSRSNFENTTDFLTRYHINGVQFYDWMYRHEQFLTEQEPYTDLLGRNLSKATIEGLINAVHDKNIAAMPYTAVYAASTPFFDEHPSWALYQANGQPYLLGKDFLVYMDPRPDSPWTNHLLTQFSEVLQELDFDGIHLDQYGDPKEGYDARGDKFSLASPLSDFIDKTKKLVLQHHNNGAVVFNAVTNWPIEEVSKSEQDFIYIEVWPPFIWFDDLHKLITQAQQLSNGKPVVLAAYINPDWENNVLLVDATIFASGGGHIELGEISGMLSDPYFPKYRSIPPKLSEILRRYYDFAVRYQEIIGPNTTDATDGFLNKIKINGILPSPNQLTDKIWPLVRETDEFTAISLINLRGITSPEWAREITKSPTYTKSITVQISDLNRDVNRVWFASPDRDPLSLQPIEFTFTEENYHSTLFFDLPYLKYWDLVIVE